MATVVSPRFLASSRTSIPAAFSQDTSLFMSSDPGDYVGGGQTYNYTTAAGSFTASRMKVMSATPVTP